MTNDEIMKAAKDAGLFTRGNGYYAVCHQTEIERFAAIIEKRTIERCAVVCDSINSERFDKAHHLHIQEDVDFVHGESAGAEECAAAIRKLGEQK